MTNPTTPADDTLRLRGTFGSRKRSGAWVVPRTIDIRTRMGSTELDFTKADFPHDELSIMVNMVGGSIELRVPANSTVDINDVTTTLGSVEDHRAAQPAGTTPHITITGKLTWGSLEVRGPKN